MSTEIEEDEEDNLERRRETFLKSQADEYEKLKKNREEWILKISSFLGVDPEKIAELVKNKTLKQIEDDYDTLKYYIPIEKYRAKERPFLDRTSMVMMWFSIALAITAAVALVFKLVIR
ncbi:MAG: hypothetical protein QW292_05820 [Candidatus Parvarchaeota archaeon]